MTTDLMIAQRDLDQYGQIRTHDVTSAVLHELEDDPRYRVDHVEGVVRLATSA